MKVLVACEFSGTVRDEFTKLGHDAISCDLLPTENPGKHYEGDIKLLLGLTENQYDLMIAHPPCTYMSNSGVCWLYKNKERWDHLADATKFFNMLKHSKIKHIAIENPIPHKYARKEIGNYTQIIQPYQFGHAERKATCLWLKNLPQLKSTKNVYEEMKRLPKNKAQRLHYLPPGKDRWKLRSKTFKGIAEAMAKQWSDYIMKVENK